MNAENEKCVIVVDENLPLGMIANTSAILGITLGMKAPDVVGDDVIDSDGHPHMGIIQFPVPVLKGNLEILKTIRAKLYDPKFEDLTAVDFSDLAQSCNDYADFTAKMSQCPEADLQYMGIAICGNKKKVNKLTGYLPLLR